MLAADNRLRDSDTFRRTVRVGRRAGGDALVVHLLVDEARTAPTALPRVGLVVSKAVGNAVVRNRVKRRLRPLVRNVLSDLPSSATVVVRALPAAAMMQSAELREELARCLGRVSRSAPAASAQTGAAS